MQSAILSVGISEAYSARRDAQRAFADSPAFLESDRRLARAKDSAADGRGSSAVTATSGKLGLAQEPSPEQRKEADLIRRGDTRIRPYESAYLARDYGAIASDGSFAVTYGADGKLPTSTNRGESVGKSAPVIRSTSETALATTEERQSGTPVSAPIRQTAAELDATPGINALDVFNVPDPPSVREAGKSLTPPPRLIAEAQVQEKIQTALESRTDREVRQTKQIERTEVASIVAKRNGEAQNVEPVSPSEIANAIVQQRLADAYQTVPRDAAVNISLFV